MTKFAHPFQLLAHDKSGTSDCSEKDKTEVFLVANGLEEPYWCTPQEMLTDLRRRARVTERQNGKPTRNDDDLAEYRDDEPIEATLND